MLIGYPSEVMFVGVISTYFWAKTESDHVNKRYMMSGKRGLTIQLLAVKPRMMEFAENITVARYFGRRFEVHLFPSRARKHRAKFEPDEEPTE